MAKHDYNIKIKVAFKKVFNSLFGYIALFDFSTCILKKKVLLFHTNKWPLSQILVTIDLVTFFPKKIRGI